MEQEQAEGPSRPPERPEQQGTEQASTAADSRAAAQRRMQDQTRWVELQIREAQRRGEFDNLPGAGKPIEDLGEHHDPDWWVKKLVEREQIHVLPPALQLRKDDAELDAVLDRLTAEKEVRRELEEFNGRVVAARRQLEGGPPVVTPTREVEHEIEAWRERREARLAALREAARAVRESSRKGWFRRRR